MCKWYSDKIEKYLFTYNFIAAEDNLNARNVDIIQSILHEGKVDVIRMQIHRCLLLCTVTSMQKSSLFLDGTPFLLQGWQLGIFPGILISSPQPHSNTANSPLDGSAFFSNQPTSQSHTQLDKRHNQFCGVW